MKHDDNTACDSASVRVELETPQVQFASDIGNYVGQVNVDDSTKSTLLERPWTPPVDYKLPHCVVTKKGKETRKFVQRSHLEKYHWLVFSHKDQGLYCKYCVLFTTGSGGNLRRLVKEPLKAFDDLLGEKGALQTHDKSKHHQSAVNAGKAFLERYHQPGLDVVNQVCTQREAQVRENRDRLRPIIKTIIFCGQQNIPLRGHRDDGHPHKLLNDADSEVSNDGNFRALLRFRVESGDATLERHLENAAAHATYISKTTQNQLIDICKDKIQEVILKRVQEAKYFSLIFDETTDISHTEQLSLSFRYLHNGGIREDFVTFCDAYTSIRPDDIHGERRLTGVALAHIVADLCTKFDVDLSNCVGIGTDSCSAMISETKGTAQELLKTATYGSHSPCNNHALNNALAKSSKVAVCRNATETMKKVVAFANSSAKRHDVFKEMLGGTSLKSICETRWVERHDGHLQFQGDTLVKICDALDQIASWSDSKSASDAQCLKHALSSPDFIVATTCLNDVLGTTVSLSRYLQTSDLDLKKATDALKDTMSVLEQKRQEADSVFHQLVSEAQKIAKKMDVELKVPRIANRQRHRENHPADTVEEYFRRAVYIPLLDSITSDLKDRLSPDVMELFNLKVFLPRTEYSEEDLEAVRKVARRYEGLLGASASVVVAEFRMWVAKWRRIDQVGEEIPDSLMDVIQACDVDLYPSIRILLKILATLPVSAATAERSFSTLRRLKTWLRSTTEEERLTGLAVLHIHRQIQLDVDEIITRFAKSSRRRLDLII